MTTVKLDNPITVEGIEVSELTFRPVKVRDCLAMERAGSSDFESDFEKEVGLIANLASVTKETIWELYFADYMKIQEELKDFFPSVTQRT
ncbi:phage tail assembly protein [Wolbachia endosymbiont (group A) of Clivina fossor]|uniref:phage tail assembly protein n=1 Tax=Wolbachia endosymbiont (group A) of Clivina fossor TaxID=3066133 RepID=UPI003132C56A